MADDRRDGDSGGGLLNLENELTCSICTDILYQPLALLDCLHSFCGECAREWFVWQATSAKNNKRTTHPYTCPSCREHVRGTKADWRLTALLEGFLKANPGRGKTEEEKEEMRRNYKPGDDILPPIRIEREEDDSEDERLLAEVRELSMANVDPDTARRRAERSSRDRQRRRQEQRSGAHAGHRPEELGRQQQASRWAAQQAERQRDAEGRQVEHQPSLRSLLSGSEISSQDVQEEILQSIHSEGLLTGIDIDNLTPQQEEELTERIAEAYRRRQRNRERSRNRDRSDHERTPTTSGHSPRPSNPPSDHTTNSRTRVDSSPSQQQPASRPRPPISRPHLFETDSLTVERNDRRSASSSSHRRQRSTNDNGLTTGVTSAARSATDLSVASETREQRPRALSSNTRSSTDPAQLRTDVHRARNTSESLRPEAMEGSSAPRIREREPRRRETGPASGNGASSTAPPAQEPSPSREPVAQLIRAAVSTSAFAPELVTSGVTAPTPPSISCSRCNMANIEKLIHYHCSICQDGNFNLCLQCYRAGKGCKYWFGFGYTSWENGPRGQELPHVLTARRYISKPPANGSPNTGTSTIGLQEGAFCESCSASANDGYWWCQYCLDGAWGFCDACVHQGKHCTHPLLPLVHLSSISNAVHDPSKLEFLQLPHLKQHAYISRPELTVYCDLCSTAIPVKESRFHCYKCSDGDYDICTPCYHKQVATGSISQSNGPNGWRRCPQGHRMAVVGYQVTQHGETHSRITYQGPVGGWRLKDEETRAPPPPNINDTGQRHWAIWNRFPGEGVSDELSFPRNAVICEVDDRNEDWAHGVYAGRVGLFPQNHTTRN